jgi:hypothetical protein
VILEIIFGDRREVGVEMLAETPQNPAIKATGGCFGVSTWRSLYFLKAGRFRWNLCFVGRRFHRR